MYPVRDSDNPYQSPCADETAPKPSVACRRSRALDLAIVGGVRGTVIGATIGGGLAVLLRGCVVLWAWFVERGEFDEIAGIEAIVAETIGFAILGTILGTISGLLIGTSLGIIAGRTRTHFRRRFLILSVATSAASGLGWSAMFGLMTSGGSHAWHLILPFLATSLVILAAATGGAWLATRIADAAWGRGDSDSLPKSEATS